VCGLIRISSPFRVSSKQNASSRRAATSFAHRPYVQGDADLPTVSPFRYSRSVGPSGSAIRGNVARGTVGRRLGDRRTVEDRPVEAGATGYLPIADHGLIGDLHSVALVGTDGTVELYCCPRFDSPSVFASILDARRGGAYRLASGRSGLDVQAALLPRTPTFITRFFTPDGVGEVEDFMPVGQLLHGEHRQRLVRPGPRCGAVGCASRWSARRALTMAVPSTCSSATLHGCAVPLSGLRLALETRDAAADGQRHRAGLVCPLAGRERNLRPGTRGGRL